MELSSEVLKKVRLAANLTTEEAGRLVHCTRAAWEHWERGTRPINKAAAELFFLKVNGEFWTNEPKYGGVVVVVGPDEVTVIDAVGRANYLGLHRTAGGKWVVKTLAVERGRITPKSVEFLTAGNEHVLRACKAWDEQRGDDISVPENQ